MQAYFRQIEKPLRVTRSIMREIEGKEVEVSRLKGKKQITPPPKRVISGGAGLGWFSYASSCQPAIWGRGT